MSSKIQLRITKKSSSQLYPDVMEIIKKHDDIWENKNFFFLNFDQFTDELQKLIDLVGTWKTTQLLFKEIKIEKITKYTPFYKTAFCKYRETCDGVCKHEIIQYQEWIYKDYFVKIARKYINELSKYESKNKYSRYGNLEVIFELLKFIEKNENNLDKLEGYELTRLRSIFYNLEENGLLEIDNNGNKYNPTWNIKLNLNSLNNMISEKLKIEESFCDIYDKNKILDILGTLKEEYSVKLRREHNNNSEIIHERSYDYVVSPRLVKLDDESINKIAAILSKSILDGLKNNRGERELNE